MASSEKSKQEEKKKKSTKETKITKTEKKKATTSTSKPKKPKTNRNETLKNKGLEVPIITSSSWHSLDIPLENSIPPDFRCRGVAAYYRQPVDEEQMHEAELYVVILDDFNQGRDIVYRSSMGEHDIVHHVFRWDMRPYQEIFQNGFQARPQEKTGDDKVYYNLHDFVHHAGTPLDSRRSITHAFISTTLNSAWKPPPNPNSNPNDVLYRYEIYAPGGIWVAQTLGDSYQYSRQDEVSFVAGIAPQYIRSAQRYRLISEANSRFTNWVRVDNELILNRNFNPQSHSLKLLTIQTPVSYYLTNDRSRQKLTINNWPDDAGPQQEKRTTDWYAEGVANSESYIDAAFRSSRTNEAYLFMKNEYVRLDYAPGTRDDKVLNGPLLICDGYPSLRGTAFAEHGIDCAFRSASTSEEVFIFSGNLCAVINYAHDWIKKGPVTIIAMFPFLKGTVFENGVDAAFESTKESEAYLFKGNQYALINYGPDCQLIIGQHLITQGFPSLGSTIFESGIDAAFASHKNNEAYIFKGDSYALMNFAPPSIAHGIIGGVKKILPNWPSLRSILPRKNGGLDVHVHSTEAGSHVDGAHSQQPPKVYKRRAKAGSNAQALVWQQPPKVYKRHAKSSSNAQALDWQQPPKVYKRRVKAGSNAQALV